MLPEPSQPGPVFSHPPGRSPALGGVLTALYCTMESHSDRTHGASLADVGAMIAASSSSSVRGMRARAGFRVVSSSNIEAFPSRGRSAMSQVRHGPSQSVASSSFSAKPRHGRSRLREHHGSSNDHGTSVPNPSVSVSNTQAGRGRSESNVKNDQLLHEEDDFRIYDVNEDPVVMVCGVAYLLGERIGAGAFGTVHSVELLIPLGTVLALDENGMPICDEGKNVIVRRISDVETNDADLDKLVLSGLCYALKVVHLPADNATKAAERREQHAYEIWLLEQLKGHDLRDHVVQIVDSEVQDTRILILLELAECDLGSWLFPDIEGGDRGVVGRGGEDGNVVTKPDRAQGNPMRSLDPWEVFGIWAQLVEAIAAIHALGVIHFDIKPKNILIFNLNGDPNGDDLPILKLADFGLARKLEGSQTHISASGGWGTLKYMAPEVVHQPVENFAFRDVGCFCVCEVVRPVRESRCRTALAMSRVGAKVSSVEGIFEFLSCDLIDVVVF